MPNYTDIVDLPEEDTCTCFSCVDKSEKRDNISSDLLFPMPNHLTLVDFPKEDTSRSKYRYSKIPHLKAATITKSVTHERNVSIPQLNDGISKLVSKSNRFECGELSLNKRKRWTLIKEFRNNIESWNESPTVAVEVIEVANRSDRWNGTESGRSTFSKTTAFHGCKNGIPIHKYASQTFAKRETLDGTDLMGKKRRKRRQMLVEKPRFCVAENGFRLPRTEVAYEIATPSKSLSLYEKYRKDPCHRSWVSSTWRNPYGKSAYDKHKKSEYFTRFITDEIFESNLNGDEYFDNMFSECVCVCECCCYTPLQKSTSFNCSVRDCLIAKPIAKTEKLIAKAITEGLINGNRLSTESSNVDSFDFLLDIDEESEVPKTPVDDPILEVLPSIEAEKLSPQSTDQPIDYNRVCQVCQSPFHWPATCVQVEKYQAAVKRAIEAAADIKLITSVFVRHCPKCDALLECNFGCNYATCVCGHVFCDFCSKSFKDEITGKWQWYHECIGINRRSYKTMPLEDINGIKQRTPWFEKSLSHRNKSANAGRLVQLVQKCIGFDFEINADSSNLACSEAHRLLEYTWVWYHFKKPKFKHIRVMCENLEFLLQLIEIVASSRDSVKLAKTLERVYVATSKLQLVLKRNQD